MDDWFDSDSSELADDLADRIKPELEPGERLIWAARSRLRPEGGPGTLVGAILVFLASGLIATLSFSAFSGVLGDRFRPIEGLLSAIGIFALFVAIGSFFIAL